MMADRCCIHWTAGSSRDVRKRIPYRGLRARSARMIASIKGLERSAAPPAPFACARSRPLATKASISTGATCAPYGKTVSIGDTVSRATSSRLNRIQCSRQTPPNDGSIARTKQAAAQKFPKVVSHRSRRRIETRLTVEADFEQYQTPFDVGRLQHVLEGDLERGLPCRIVRNGHKPVSVRQTHRMNGGGRRRRRDRGAGRERKG